jgi:hypothetical protein
MYVCMYVRMYVCTYVFMYVLRSACSQCGYVLCVYGCMYVFMHACVYVYACMYACRDVGNYATLCVYADGLDFQNAHYERRVRYCEGPLALAIHVSLPPFPCISLR